jgi:hypothetical protein
MKPRGPFLRVATGSVLLLASALAWSHHSFAMFDRQTDLVLTGTVKEFQWSNPHSYIQLIADKDGNNWSIEGAGVNSLVRTGWKPKSLSSGDKITVHLHPLRNGAPGGELMWVKKADGSVLGDVHLGDPPAAEPAPAAPPASP